MKRYRFYTMHKVYCGRARLQSAIAWLEKEAGRFHRIITYRDEVMLPDKPAAVIYIARVQHSPGVFRILLNIYRPKGGITCND